MYSEFNAYLYVSLNLSLNSQLHVILSPRFYFILKVIHAESNLWIKTELMCIPAWIIDLIICDSGCHDTACVYSRLTCQGKEKKKKPNFTSRRPPKFIFWWFTILASRLNWSNVWVREGLERLWFNAAWRGAAQHAVQLNALIK